MKVKFVIYLCLLFLFVPISFADNLDKLADMAYKKVNKNPSKYEIVYSFCKNVYSLKKFGDKNANDSIFLNILCKSIDFKKNSELDISLKEKELKYFTNLKEDAEKLEKLSDEDSIKASTDNIIKSVVGACKKFGIVTDSNNLNNINFVCVARKLLKVILNDYTKIGVYVAYGGFQSDKDFKKWEKDFFAGTGADDVCENSYLSSDNDSHPWCKHERIFDYIESVKASLKQLLKSFQLLDLNSNDIYEKLLKGDNKFVTLVNRMYLEYYFYNLFINYYTVLLQASNFSTQTKVVGTNSKILSKGSNDDEINQAKMDTLIFGYAIKRSLSYMKNIYWTFPIHIGFLAIIEDFKELRKHLAWIYTPIDQLRYKLENAQDEDKK